MEQTILITGSNGLLGQKLVHLLSQFPEIKLIATAKGPNRLTGNLKYTYVSLDITNEVEVFEVFKTYQPDAVIHTAAMTNVDTCEADPEGCELLNVTAVSYLINACKSNNTFFCHVSTDFIFDGLSGPYDENAKPCPISIYGESKLKAEQLLQASTIKWGIARTILVFGIVEDNFIQYGFDKNDDGTFTLTKHENFEDTWECGIDTLNLDKNVSISNLNSFTSSINTTIKTKLDAETVVSGSSQIDITATTGYNTFSASIETRISIIDGGTY